jgi:hypothetical protein
VVGGDVGGAGRRVVDVADGGAVPGASVGTVAAPAATVVGTADDAPAPEPPAAVVADGLSESGFELPQAATAITEVRTRAVPARCRRVQ